MKRMMTNTAMISVILMAGSLALRAQGVVNFVNNSGTRVTNTLTLQPVVAGTTYQAALYYAPDRNGGCPNPCDVIQLGPAVGFSNPGIYNGGWRTTPTLTPHGGPACFQVRIWESAFGSTFEAAEANTNLLGGRPAILIV